MQYDAETPEEYLSSLEEDWRKEKLNKLRKIILSKDSSIEETIEYRMLAFQIGEQTVFHLNAQKNYVSLYVGNIKKIDTSGELLEGLNMGKGCIRFTKTVDISETRIETFVERTLELAESGMDTDC